MSRIELHYKSVSNRVSYPKEMDVESGYSPAIIRGHCLLNDYLPSSYTILDSILFHTVYYL